MIAPRVNSREAAELFARADVRPDRCGNLWRGGVRITEETAGRHILTDPATGAQYTVSRPVAAKVWLTAHPLTPPQPLPDGALDLGACWSVTPESYWRFFRGSWFPNKRAPRVVLDDLSAAVCAAGATALPESGGDSLLGRFAGRYVFGPTGDVTRVSDGRRLSGNAYRLTADDGTVVPVTRVRIRAELARAGEVPLPFEGSVSMSPEAPKWCATRGTGFMRMAGRDGWMSVSRVPASVAYAAANRLRA